MKRVIATAERDGLAVKITFRCRDERDADGIHASIVLALASGAVRLTFTADNHLLTVEGRGEAETIQ